MTKIQREWGAYTLTITNKEGIVIKTIEYTRMSGTAMMDEAFSWRSRYKPSDGHKVDWE